MLRRVLFLAIILTLSASQTCLAARSKEQTPKGHITHRHVSHKITHTRAKHKQVAKSITHVHHASHKASSAQTLAQALPSPAAPVLASYQSPLLPAPAITDNKVALPAPQSHFAAAKQYLANYHWQNPHLLTQSLAFANATEQRIVSLVHETVGNMHYSVYELGGTYFNLAEGVYKLDCSDYVDHLLHQAAPRAYLSLMDWSRSSKPTSLDYFDFFNRLPDQAWNNWRKVNTVDQLKPGDILVFRYKNLWHRRAGGHVMVVMSKPVQGSNSNVFMVRVADAASAGHTEDTRAPHKSGIGIGTLLLKVNPVTQTPDAYAWKVGAPWQNNTEYAMAEPISVTDEG